VRSNGVAEQVEVVVVGAGQAGLAVSYYLRAFGVEHVVLERGRAGESWRSARWDSFTLVTPNWMTRLPGYRMAAGSGDGFEGAEGRSAPAILAATAAQRLDTARLAEAAAALGTPLPSLPMFLVPLQTSDTYVGTLVLADPNGESPDDRLMESFASRAAAAYLHAVQSRR